MKSPALVMTCQRFFQCGSLQGGKMAASSFQNDVYLCSHPGKEFSQLLFTCVEPPLGWTNSKPFTVISGVALAPCLYLNRVNMILVYSGETGK